MVMCLKGFLFISRLICFFLNITVSILWNCNKKLFHNKTCLDNRQRLVELVALELFSSVAKCVSLKCKLCRVKLKHQIFIIGEGRTWVWYPFFWIEKSLLQFSVPNFFLLFSSKVYLGWVTRKLYKFYSFL